MAGCGCGGGVAEGRRASRRGSAALPGRGPMAAGVVVRFEEGYQDGQPFHRRLEGWMRSAGMVPAAVAAVPATVESSEAPRLSEVTTLP